MSTEVEQQLLKEIKEMRAELKEVRTALFDDDTGEDSLDAYDHPEAIVQALTDAKKAHGEPLA